MLPQLLSFILGLALLLVSAQYFTQSAERIGVFFRLPSFVIGVFIVGIGTSLPELISSIISVQQGVSEIVPGNIMGANITNILLTTGVIVCVHGRAIVLSKSYLFIDLHFMMGAVLMFVMISYDGVIRWDEALIGLVGFVVYSFYLIKSEPESEGQSTAIRAFPWISLGILGLTGVGIYLGAQYTVGAITALAEAAQIPPSIVALTVLSIGTTLPELAVNISAIRQGKAEMAIGNVLGSSVFNAMVIPAMAAFWGDIHVPANLIWFSMPCFVAASVLFYMLVQDKRISVWEGILFILIYGLFMLKVVGI